ncbi:MAG: GDP-L-fucose synthase, partial [Pseudomonadota bacterium]
NYSDAEIVNVGWGSDIAIGEFAKLIADIVGFQGRIVFDHSRPDGTPRKLVDTARLTSIGWAPKIGLRDGLERTYKDYAATHQSGAN